MLASRMCVCKNASLNAMYVIYYVLLKNKASNYRPGQAVRSLGLQDMRSHFIDIRHIKMVWLSSLRTGRLYPAGDAVRD
jgi:hypothetical protein